MGFPGVPDRCGLSWSSIVLCSIDKYKILVDLGAPMARRPLLRELAKRSISLQEINMILLTHLHYDHIMNCDLFPDALYVFSETEWIYANSSEDTAISKWSIQALNSFQKQLLKKDHETIIPGVKALFTPGHTPGSVTYVLDCGSDKMAILGDAIKNRGELQSGLTNNSAVSRNLQKIMPEANVLLPGHDCRLRINELSREVVPMEENEVKFVFDGGMTVNGQNPVCLRVD
jgi:glyoxylase-like metal-dependent hydrolase (beta-lactamase superfamily II)